MIKNHPLSTEERLTQLITKELIFFLLSSKDVPNCIDITASYGNSRACLKIEKEKIIEAFQ